MIFSARRKISAKIIAYKEKSDAKCSNLTKLNFTHPPDLYTTRRHTVIPTVCRRLSSFCSCYLFLLLRIFNRFCKPPPCCVAVVSAPC